MQILVADDDRSSRLLVRASLEKLGHDADLVADGEEAWGLYREAGADVLITDRLMPGLDGLELCRRIRAEPVGAYTYIVMMAGREEQGVVLAAMEAGADDHLTKPVDPFDLQAGLVAAQRVTGLHRQLERYRIELERLNADLADLARRDALTGLGNRLRLDEDLAQLHWRCSRYAWTYSLAVCDLDHFKAHNDEYGHLAGDEVLRQTAAALKASARRGDGVYRYGGEEFVVILPGQRFDLALVAGERLRAAVGEATPVTMSVGVAAYADGDLSPSDVLRRADEALYRAKEGGRNRVSE
jgi:two-component system chemotaxis response regulator CheY